MNQTLIIASFNKMLKGEGRIMNMSPDGFLTPEWMLSKGMFSCFSCGHLNNIEATHCNGCHDEKFIVREAYKEFTYKAPRHTYYKLV